MGSLKVRVEVIQSCPILCDHMDCCHLAPLFMEFSRQEHWSGLPFHSLGDLPNPGIKHRPPALQANSLPCEQPGNLQWVDYSPWTLEHYNRSLVEMWEQAISNEWDEECGESCMELILKRGHLEAPLCEIIWVKLNIQLWIKMKELELNFLNLMTFLHDNP